jgi:hypothetical protein
MLRKLYSFDILLLPMLSSLGGQSVWKKAFQDEFKPNLTHSGMFST